MEEIGKIYNKLTVVSKTSRTNTQGRYFYVCRCECGKEKEIVINSLKNGLTKSCGCLRSDYVAKRNKDKARHNLRCKPEYGIWSKMIARCRNKTCVKYKDYGGRGIDVCDRWLDVVNFYNDLGPRPTKDHKLNRVDKTKGYNPENCEWADTYKTNLGKKSAVMIGVGEEAIEATVLAKMLGVRRDTLIHRKNSGIVGDRLLSQDNLSGGFNKCEQATFYIYESDDFIGFGITRYLPRRDKQHKRNVTKHGKSIRLLKTYVSEGKFIFDLEQEIKSIFADKIINTGIDGFKTEAIPLKYKDGLISLCEIFMVQGL